MLYNVFDPLISVEAIEAIFRCHLVTSNNQHT